MALNVKEGYDKVRQNNTLIFIKTEPRLIPRSIKMTGKGLDVL